MLTLDHVNAFYGDSHILHDVSLDLHRGEVVSILGRNGAGKTTTLLTIMGYLTPKPGTIVLGGTAIGGQSPHRVSRRGVGFVPQERGVFSSLTVEENLTVAARSAGKPRWTLTDIYALFPRLKERRRNLGFQLSGGEQQMVSIARALMLNPEILLLDEPSEGLAPMIVDEIATVIRCLKGEGMAILMVEQNLRIALALGDRHYVLSKGAICFTGTTADIENNTDVQRAHLSV